MLRIVNIVAGLSLSASAFGASPTHFVREEVVLQAVKVDATSGGINPDKRAYIVSGQVQLGSNSCFAQGLQGKLRVENQADGTRHVVAYVEGWQPKDLICIEIYKPVFADVKVTVRGDTNLADIVFVRNVEELGTLQPLSSFLNDPAITDQCNRPVLCTREFLPTTCTLNGHAFAGNNKCQALSQAKNFACQNEIPLLAEEVVCERTFAAAE